MGQTASFHNYQALPHDVIKRAFFGTKTVLHLLFIFEKSWR